MRLATFNVLHGRSLADNEVDLGRFAAACASLGADLLALQEVDRGQPRSHGADLTALAAEASGAVAWRFEPALHGTPGGAWSPAGDGDERADAGSAYGVALVSRHPVTDWSVVRLASSGRVRAPVLVPGTRRLVWLTDEPRLAVCGRVRAPGFELSVAATHLSFVPGWNLVQLRQLAAALRRRLPPPYAILGDLNSIGRLPSLVTGWRSLGAAKTYPAAKPVVQFDHVLASGLLPPVAGARAVELPVSDHRAFVVDLA